MHTHSTIYSRPKYFGNYNAIFRKNNTASYLDISRYDPITVVMHIVG
jgi:hypothetical protein